jgi:hypothetical protein
VHKPDFDHVIAAAAALTAETDIVVVDMPRLLLADSMIGSTAWHR